jgi:hypothetical protein
MTDGYDLTKAICVEAAERTADEFAQSIAWESDPERRADEIDVALRKVFLARVAAVSSSGGRA